MSPHPGTLDSQHGLPPDNYGPTAIRPKILETSTTTAAPIYPHSMRPVFKREATDDANRQTTDMNNLRKPKFSDYFSGYSKSSLDESPDEEDESPSTKLLDIEYLELPPQEQRLPPPQRNLWPFLTPFLFLVIILQSLVLLSLFVYHHSRTNSPASHETIFPDIPPHLQTPHLKRFTYALHAHDNGTLYPFPTTSPYTGPNASFHWKALITNRYFRLTDAEVTRLNTAEQKTEQDGLPSEPDNNDAYYGSRNGHILAKLPFWKDAVPDEGYYGGIDMLHSLHCLDSLRRAISHSPHWPPSITTEAESDDYDGGEEEGDEQMFLLPGEPLRLHLDHCLEQLRQAILCHADATPVTLRPIVSEFVDGRDGKRKRVLTMLGETERVHTCQGDGMGLVEWVRERARVGGSV